MPIRDIVENEKITGRYPRIAKLHKGEPKKINPKTGREVVGRDQEHFRIVFEPEFEYLMKDWVELYGEKPMNFSPVVLDARTTDDALDFWQEEWDSTETLLHRCDGKFQHNWFDRRTGFYMKSQVACAIGECHCTPVGRMNLLFPDFIVKTGVIGYIMVETGSLEDIRTIRDRLRAIEASFGTLAGVHLTFGRAKRKVNRPEVKNGERTGKRMKTTASMLYLLPTPEFAKNVLLPVLMGAVQPPVIEQPALPPQVNMSTDTARKLLGNGGSRRINTETQGNGGNGHDEPPIGQDKAWTDDQAFWGRFLAWANDRFNLGEVGVLSAMNNAVDYEVNTRADWRKDSVVATAAVIAYACDYDPVAIHQVCDAHSYSPAARNAAIALIGSFDSEEVQE